MITVISDGEFSDYTILGVVDVPEGFNVQEEFEKFLEASGVPKQYSEERQEKLLELYKSLTGDNNGLFASKRGMLMPWLTSIGYPEIEWSEQSQL